MALVLSSAISSAVGMLYWVVAARMFDPATVGINTTVVSTLGLLGIIAQLNLGSAMLRFVPVVGRGARALVAACYATGIGAALVIGTGFALGAGWWAPELQAAVGAGALIAYFAARDAVLDRVQHAGLPAHRDQAGHGRAVREPRLRAAQDRAAGRGRPAGLLRRDRGLVGAGHRGHRRRDLDLPVPRAAAAPAEGGAAAVAGHAALDARVRRGRLARQHVPHHRELRPAAAGFRRARRRLGGDVRGGVAAGLRPVPGADRDGPVAGGALGGRPLGRRRRLPHDAHQVAHAGGARRARPLGRVVAGADGVRPSTTPRPAACCSPSRCSPPSRRA